MKKGILLIFILIHNVISDPLIPVSISIPKCGTHMLKDLLMMLLHKKPKDIPWKFDEASFFVMSNFHPHNFYFGHTWPSKRALDFFSDRVFRGFFLIRDPRDMVVSFYDYMKKLNRPPHLYKLPFDDIVEYLILNPTLRPSNQFPTSTINASLEERYRIFLQWGQLPNFCLIRYEDLVGPRGGGSREVQFKTIEKIAHHLNLSITREQCEFISKSLYGKSGTFNKGQIGRWKKCFTKKLTRIFRENFSDDFLLQLGYEETP